MVAALVLLSGCSGETFGTMHPMGEVLDAAGPGDAATGQDAHVGQDAGPDQPGGDAAVAQCGSAADCPVVDAYQCLQGLCVEFACHAQKACSNVEVCEDHACVPFVPPERFPTAFFQSSGGGTAANPRLRVRLSAGAPQPMRTAQSGKYKLTLGAGAGRP